MQNSIMRICSSAALLLGMSLTQLNAAPPDAANAPFATVYAFEGFQINQVAELSNLVVIDGETVEFDVHFSTGQQITLRAVHEKNGEWTVLEGNIELAKVKPAGDALRYSTIFGGTGFILLN